MVDLYGRAFAQFQCAELWTPYLRLIERLCDESTVDDEVLVCAFEKATTCVGMHMVEGPEVWQLFREYLKDELQDMQETGGAEDKQLAIQTKIQKLYIGQLSIPLPGNHTVLEEMKAQFPNWDSWGGASVISAHQKAQEMLEERVKHEAAVMELQVEADLASASVTNKSIPSTWVEYIELELSNGELARAQFLFERALSEGWYVFPDLWSWYSDVLVCKLASRETEKQVMERAVRTIPASAQLWIRMMQSLERVGEDYNSVRTAMKHAQQHVKPKADSLKVEIALCDMARRCAVGAASSSSGENCNVNSTLVNMRHAFTEAENVALNLEWNHDEEWMNIVQYKAWAETSFENCGGKSPKDDWERLVKRCGKMAKAWLAYISWQQRQKGGGLESDDSCKKLFHRALSSTTDDPESICEAFLLYEAQSGSLSNLSDAQYKVARKRHQMKLDPKYKHQKMSAKRPRATSHEDVTNRGYQRVEGKGNEEDGSAVIKDNLKRPRKLGDATPKAAVMECVRSTVHVSNLAKGVTEDNLKEVFQSCGAIHVVHIAQDKKTGMFKSSGLVQFVDPSPVPAAIRLSGTDIGGQTINVRHSKFAVDQEAAAVNQIHEQRPPSSEMGESGSTHEPEFHESTVFVAGLAKTVTNDTLEQAFLSCGPIKAVHIVLDKKGKSKGFGLVQFEEPSGRVKAEQLSGTSLAGKTMVVKPSKFPAQSKRDRIIRDARSKPISLFRPRAILLSHEDHPNHHHQQQLSATEKKSTSSSSS